jgi:P4 family phage/plasmid primase-like protien
MEGPKGCFLDEPGTRGRGLDETQLGNVRWCNAGSLGLASGPGSSDVRWLQRLCYQTALKHISITIWSFMYTQSPAPGKEPRSLSPVLSLPADPRASINFDGGVGTYGPRRDANEASQVYSSTVTLLDTSDAAVARRLVEAAIMEVHSGDVGAPFRPDVLSAIHLIRETDYPAFQRIRGSLKKYKISLTDLDRALRQCSASRAATETHDFYARDVLNSLTVDQFLPVAQDGQLYVVDASTSLWIPCTQAQVVQLVTRRHDNKKNCTRSGDYQGIARHAVQLASAEAFFEEAAVGLACPGGFYRVDGNAFTREDLSPQHRQRVQIAVDPREQATPLFDAFLNETFASPDKEEEAQQRRLVQEIVGAVVLGQMAKFEKAVLFYDRYGRAGKGTLDKIIQQLVPTKFTNAVSPFDWDDEYYLYSLSGIRLNTVGELPEDKSIPAAQFKKVIGRDPVTGRAPGGLPLMFRNEAAHIFTSNYLINTRDHSPAFYGRWLIVEFPNSRLKPGAAIDPDLADRIIANELPGILQWSLEGASRLLKNNKFSSSLAHERLLAKWQTQSSSLEEFVDEACDCVPETQSIRRSEFYEAYVQWCSECGRKPFSKSKVLEKFEQNIRLKVKHARLNGIEIFRGLAWQSSAEDSTLVDDDRF